MDKNNLPKEMHVVQEERHAPPDFQCVTIPEVPQETLEMMVEEEMDLTSLMMARLLNLIMIGDHLTEPAGDPNPDGHHDRDARLYKSMTINKWAKPIPKLDLPPRIHTQKTSKIKQIWETWCVQVALALSTWNSLAVPYWSDIYGQAERDYEKWRKSTMSARYKHETRFLYGRKAPIPPNCDAIEALLRLELLTQFPDWLTRKGHYARLYILS